MARTALFVALALQLLGCLAPANAFVICLSNDGCVELEPAAPGAGRCAENTCDEAHAGNTSHTCRDIPIFVDARTPSRSFAADYVPFLTTVITTPLVEAPAVTSVPWSRTAPPDAVTRPRTVVLQL